MRLIQPVILRMLKLYLPSIKNNRLSTNINNRVQVGIAGLTGGAQAFSCAIIGLELSATSAASVSGMCGYKLVMIGVEL